MMEVSRVQQEWKYSYDDKNSKNCPVNLNHKLLLDLDSNVNEWAWSDLVTDESVSDFFSVDENLINKQEESMIPHDAEEVLTYDEIFSDFSSNPSTESFGSEDGILELFEIEENLMEDFMMEQEPVGSCRDAMSIEAEETNCVTTTATTTSSETLNDWATGGLIPCDSGVEYKGMLLVHLLTACAEAMSDGSQDLADGSHDLADILLCRLREMVSATGSTMERVAYYLFRYLQQRHHQTSSSDGESLSLNSNDMGAFSLLNQVYPFIRIAHFTANQSILEAIKGNRRKKIHVIDFDIMEGMQWPPLMEALKSEGYKFEQLKITALKWDCEDEEDDDDEVPFLCKQTGRRLSEFADSVGIPFLFEETELQDLKGSYDEEEIIAVNCMWELPHMSQRDRKKLFEFIDGARQLNPVILTVGTGPPQCHENLNLLESFGECLRNLCAVFDCSEAGLPDQYGLARAKLERLFLAPMMCRPLDYYPSEENGQLVVDIPLKRGFTEGEISSKNTMFAKQMVETAVGRHYRLECVGNNKLFLAWQSTILSCVSTWKPTSFL